MDEALSVAELVEDEALTVAEIVEREGLPWPAADPDREPRHLLDEPEPQPGELVGWFHDDTPADLVRPYMRARAEGTL